MFPTKKIEMGRLLKTHGLHGEFKLEPYTDDITAYQDYTRFYIDNVPYNVEYYKPLGNFMIIKLEGIDDIDTAEKFRGAELILERQDISAELILNDILDMDVYYKEELLGNFIRFNSSGANILFEIEINGKEYFIPYIDRYFVDINSKENRIVLDNLDELVY